MPYRLCNIIISWEDIRALVASPLIVLDKYPGIGPIGIDETLHRIVEKITCLATCIDVTEACGSGHLCACLSSVIEGAVYASPYGWGVLMVDASNVFNTLNCTYYNVATGLCALASLWKVPFQYILRLVIVDCESFLRIFAQ